MSKIEDDIRRATEAIRASRPRSKEPVHSQEITFAEPETLPMGAFTVRVIPDAESPFPGQDYVFICDPVYGEPESGLVDWIPTESDE